MFSIGLCSGLLRVFGKLALQFKSSIVFSILQCSSQGLVCIPAVGLFNRFSFLLLGFLVSSSAHNLNYFLNVSRPFSVPFPIHISFNDWIQKTSNVVFNTNNCFACCLLIYMCNYSYVSLVSAFSKNCSFLHSLWTGLYFVGTTNLTGIYLYI